MDDFLNVSSEIGRLEAVLLHRPGGELENLIPDYLDELLFEDIPWLKKIQEEHDAFARVLENQGCRVYYYSRLLQDILADGDVKKTVIEELLSGPYLEDDSFKNWVKGYFDDLSGDSFADVLISGLRKEDIAFKEESRILSSQIVQGYPFYLNPLANLYFTRDPGVVIEDQLIPASMRRSARKREPFLLKIIQRFHPLFTLSQGPDRRSRPGAGPVFTGTESWEGGDILVPDSASVIMGCSSRTSAGGIERAALSLLRKKTVRRIMVIEIPFIRAYMHLDTVLTMVDRDKFTIFPGIEKRMEIFLLRLGDDGHLVISRVENLKTGMKELLGLPAVQFIPSGGKNRISAAREQWSDSTNTLAVAPGKVITYNRNEASNETLVKHGVEVLEIEGSELVRGRGGPRCMSMPLKRAPLT